MFDALILDCDGVLIDSELLSCATDVETLARYGIGFAPRAYMDRFIGKRWADVLAELEREFPGRLPPEFTEILQERKAQAFRASLKAIAGVRETLSMGPLAELPRCVASGSSLERLALSLGVTGLAPLFEPHIYSAEQVSRGKPAPDLFLMAAGRLGVAPESCVVVEDSPSGVRAAVAAGMLPLGFVGGAHCGPTHSERLRDAGAVAILNRFADLPDLLAALSPSLV